MASRVTPSSSKGHIVYWRHINGNGGMEDVIEAGKFEYVPNSKVLNAKQWDPMEHDLKAELNTGSPMTIHCASGDRFR